MNPNLGQWSAVATIVAEHCSNPDLITAVDAELAQARNETEQPTEQEAS